MLSRWKKNEDDDYDGDNEDDDDEDDDDESVGLLFDNHLQYYQCYYYFISSTKWKLTDHDLPFPLPLSLPRCSTIFLLSNSFVL